jgi:hypothetical protein
MKKKGGDLSINQRKLSERRTRERSAQRVASCEVQGDQTSFFEKNAQNEAQPIFCQKPKQTSMGKGTTKSWATSAILKSTAKSSNRPMCEN